MPDSPGHLDEIGAVVKELARLGLQPVLVGGMALVILGSRRVTRDYDFVIAQPGARVTRLLDLLYDRGFELASRVNDTGDITATIDNRRVAGIRLRLDRPPSAFFWHHGHRLRIDLLFDYPIPAAALAEHAIRRKVGSHVLRVACEADLLRLKKLAQTDRSFAGDAQDIEFLEARRRRRSRG
jgi:hypothetical protein